MARYFGTDGVRGQVGESPMTVEFTLRLASAVARVLAPDGGTVLIGKDTRVSGYMFEAALEAGAEDVVEGENFIDIVSPPGDFEQVKRTLTERGFTPAHAAISLEPSTTVELKGKEAETMLRLADALEDLDDIQSVNANFDISEQEMAKIAG